MREDVMFSEVSTKIHTDVFEVLYQVYRGLPPHIYESSNWISFDVGNDKFCRLVNLTKRDNPCKQTPVKCESKYKLLDSR